MFDKVLKAVLLFSPIAYTTGIPWDKFNLIAFPIYVSASFIASLFSKPQRECDLKLIGYLLILGILNLFWHNFHPVVFSSFINLVLGCIALILIVRYCGNPSQCFVFMMWAGIINIAVFAAQRAGFSPIINISEEPGGIFGNAPRLCMYLTIILPFVFKANKWVFGLFALTGIICKEILLPFMAVIIVFFYFQPFGKIWHYWIFLGLCVMGLWLAWSHIIRAFMLRWVLWKPTIETICNSWLKGYGLGTFSALSPQFAPSLKPDTAIIWHAENCFSSLLQFIFHAGIGALAWIGFFARKIYRYCELTPEFFGITAIAFLSLVEYPFEVPRLWPTVIAVISFYLISIKEDYNAGFSKS